MVKYKYIKNAKNKCKLYIGTVHQLIDLYQIELIWRKIEENNKLFQIPLLASSIFVDTQDYAEASLQYLKIKLVIIFNLLLLDY